MLEIYEDQIQAQVVIGKIVEDVRHGSPTQGCQFVILDSNNGVVSIQKLDDEEYVVSSLIYSRIIK